MAIQWSASSGYMSVGVELWYTGDPHQGFVEVYAQFWLRSDGYGHNFTAATSWWGNVGEGSETVSFSSPRGATVYKDMGTSHWREDLLPNQERSVGVGYSLGPIWNGGRPSLQAWLTLPARPAKPPTAPSYCKAALLPDGKSVSVSWPAAKPADSSSPIRSYVIERWDAYADNQSGPWLPREWHVVTWVNVTGSNAPSFSVIDDRAVYPNNRFWYRVYASPVIPTRVRDVSDFVPGPASPMSAGVSTRPAPVTELTASKTRDGKISISWTTSFPYPQDATVEIYDGDDKVGTVRADADGWVHTNADLQVPHTYYAYVKTDSLESNRSAPSNTIQVLQKPGIPGVRKPGAYAPVGQVMVAWSHTSIDETWQEAAEIRYARVTSEVGNTPSWTTVSVSGAAQEKVLDLPAGVYTYQIRTKGQFREYSEWSPARRTTVTYAPVVALAPNANTLDKSVFEGAISVSHVQGSSTTISTVVAELLSADMQIIEQISGDASVIRAIPSFSRAALVFKARLENKTAYVVRIALTDGFGLTTSVERRYNVEYPTPPQPIVTAEWEETEGDMLISIASPSIPAGAKTPATVETRLERSIDGGSTWTLVADRLPPSTMYRDRQCMTNGVTKYRVTATSAMPSSSVTIVDALADSQAVWLSAGQGFSRVARLAWDPATGSSMGLVNREVKHFAGRDLGVEMSGTQRQRVVTVSATLVDASERERRAVEDLAFMPAPFMYRDPLGRVLYGSLSDVQLDREVGGIWRVSAKLTEVGV